MPIRTSAPLAAAARSTAVDEGLPTLVVVRTSPSSAERRGELDAALQQQVRELGYTLHRGTVPGRPSAAIEELAGAAFAGSEDTRRHAERTSRYLVLLAGAVGYDAASSPELRLAVFVRELGRTGMPDGLVTASGRTNRREGPGTSVRVLHHAAAVAVASNEWWDGSGYPRGLRRDEIPEVARLAAVVEVFDALTSDHRRQPGHPRHDVVTTMRDLSGHRLEPRLVEAFLSLEDQVEAIRAAFPARAPAFDGPASRSKARPQPANRRFGASLTRREMEVLGLIAAGLPNKQIANELGLRLNTVRNHVQNVLYKLRSHSKLEAVATAVRERLISYPAP